MKNSQNGIDNSLEMADERISELLKKWKLFNMENRININIREKQ